MPTIFRRHGGIEKVTTVLKGPRCHHPSSLLRANRHRNGLLAKMLLGCRLRNGEASNYNFHRSLRRTLSKLNGVRHRRGEMRAQRIEFLTTQHYKSGTHQTQATFAPGNQQNSWRHTYLSYLRRSLTRQSELNCRQVKFVVAVSLVVRNRVALSSRGVVD